MTALADRPARALLVIDLQVGVLAEVHDRDTVVGRVADLVERARANDVPVIWVQHNGDELPRGSAGWQFVEEVDQHDHEPVVHKQHGDAFEGTDLEEVLAARHIGRLVVAGAQTDACVRSTIHGGFSRGYDVDLVTDAHTTEDLTQWGAPPPPLVISHTNLYWQFQSGPDKQARAVSSVEVDFAAS